ncbi:MAG TPA: SLC13 family permease [candidate division Zixibacteria bacterium]|nr:SLC13 family permease [candidate division Zixibacteria bacterium]
MNDVAESIRSIPIFSGLSREDIAKILGKMDEVSLGPGVTVFAQGDEGDAFYLIQSGAVQVVIAGPSGRSEIIAVLGPQDWFGEMALLSGEPRSATIVTIKDTALWKLSRDAWNELIEKHPTWLLRFCATLSKRLSRADQQYSTGREAFNSLAEEFYASRPAEEQAFLRRASLLNTIDPATVGELIGTQSAAVFLPDLQRTLLPLIRPLDSTSYELHDFFRQFLKEKLVAVEGPQARRELHAGIAQRYEELGQWQEAIHHAVEIQDWERVIRLVTAQADMLLDSAPVFLKETLDRLPRDRFFATPQLVHAKAGAMAHLGDLPGAFRTYREVLSQLAQGSVGAEVASRYLGMADALSQRQEYTQAISCLRSALQLVEHEVARSADYPPDGYTEAGGPLATVVPKSGARVRALLSRLLGPSTDWLRRSSFSKAFGAALGLGVWAYLWFAEPDIGLDLGATKLLGLLSLTLIYWVFWVLPDYGVALIFALGLILARLASPESVLGGFASTTWFMTLAVLGLGAAITGSGLFYRLSLHLVRLFPLNFYWQVFATGLMGVVVMALIPQQTARTAITSQMLVNLSESLGYKTPSRASTGLFAASFLGLGQLGFLFLTGSTTSLIAWGLLPNDVRAQFTWGYWFVAALPPTLVVIAVILLCIAVLFRPEVQPRISYRMVTTQLDVLGPLSHREWVSFAVLCFTVAGWLTVSYHGIDGAWIALIGFAVLVNTGALGWGILRKGIDWELLIYMGVTLSIPSLLTRARIDQWLVDLISPLITPFLENPAMLFIAIALLTYALKLFFTSFLTVVTLSVALIPLSVDIGMSPWVIAMIILMASEVWFFPFQVDWHTLAYSTSERKGFSYPFMCRLNPFYALAYIAAMIAAIPYWRYLGLMG